MLKPPIFYYAISIFILLGCSDEVKTLSTNDSILLDTTTRKPLETVETPLIDLAHIKERGKLIALSRYNAHSFFIHKGKPMGYEYDLLKLFTKEIGVDLEVKTSSTWDSLYIMLENGEGDLIAANLTVTIDKSKSVSFSKPHNTTRQMLIQRKPKNYRKLKKHQIDKKVIRNTLDLIGKTVAVRKVSPYYTRLENLNQVAPNSIRL